MSQLTEKAVRVFACCGKAPKGVDYLDSDELARVAALLNDDGLLVEGGAESLRLLLIEHYERRKATVAELEPPIVGTGVDHPFVESEVDDEPTSIEDEEE